MGQFQKRKTETLAWIEWLPWNTFQTCDFLETGIRISPELVWSAAADLGTPPSVISCFGAAIVLKKPKSTAKSYLRSRNMGTLEANGILQVLPGITKDLFETSI